MSNEEYRKNLVNHIGKTKYIKLVKSIYSNYSSFYSDSSIRQNLFFWEEKILENFLNKYALAVPNIKELSNILNHCPKHNIILKEQLAKDSQLEIYLNKDIELKKFPLANVTQSIPIEGGRSFNFRPDYLINYCDVCREERSFYLSTLL